MKVLMISGDKNMLVPGSEAYQRAKLQRAQVERLDIFIWPQVHTAREIFHAARTSHYDVVTAQDPFWRGHLAWHLARRTGARLNVQVHTDLAAEPWWRRAWARFQLRHADSIRVVSERMKEYLAPLHLRAPISILPVYVDLSRFVGLEHKSYPRFKKVLLWIGRFEPEKDPFQALSILRQVRDAGIDAGLIMLGAGSLESELKRAAFPVAPWVEFPGWQDPGSYLAMADAVICTSQYESYGVSIIEALAAGVPVVAPDVGIAREAGAYIADPTGLAFKAIGVLRSGARGELKLTLPTAEEWAKRWEETLV